MKLEFVRMWVHLVNYCKLNQNSFEDAMNLLIYTHLPKTLMINNWSTLKSNSLRKLAHAIYSNISRL